MLEDFLNVAHEVAFLLFFEEHFFHHTTAELENDLGLIFAQSQLLDKQHYTCADVFCCLDGDIKFYEVGVGLEYY